MRKKPDLHESLKWKGGGGGGPRWKGDWGERADTIVANNSTLAYSGVTLHCGSGASQFSGTGNTIDEISPGVPVITTKVED